MNVNLERILLKFVTSFNSSLSAQVQIQFDLEFTSDGILMVVVRFLERFLIDFENVQFLEIIQNFWECVPKKISFFVYPSIQTEDVLKTDISWN